MTETISQRELRNDSARILRAVDAGESFVITRHDHPVGELIPLHRARLVDLTTIKQSFLGSPLIDRVEFFRDVDDIIDQDAEPRG